MHLVLSRVTDPSDFDQIVPLLYEAFDGSPQTAGDLRCIYFGNESPSNLIRTKNYLVKDMQTDPTDYWVKVVDEDADLVDVRPIGDGESTATSEKRKRIVCCANWKIRLSLVNANHHSEEAADMSYLDTEDERKDGLFLMKEVSAGQIEIAQEPQVFCFILCTSKQYQGRGSGRLVMDWGTAVADALLLPCWIEASDRGLPLYKSCGFRETKLIELKGNRVFEIHYTQMRRPVMYDKVVTVKKGEFSGEQE